MLRLGGSGARPERIGISNKLPGDFTPAGPFTPPRVVEVLMKQHRAKRREPQGQIWRLSLSEIVGAAHV